ncbi:MAG: alkyl hydroperoxide reductase [Cyanobacteria bacterium SBC]|nr:alkyl hydroperoxide reductase [Cyanobacteria bacterium SBC]
MSGSSLFTLPESLRPIYEASFGIDLPAHNGDDTFELPIPATYAISPRGEIVYAFVESDYTQRLDPETLLEALRSLTATVA